MEEQASTVSTEVSPAPAPPLATEGREGLFDPLNFNFKTFEKIDFQPEYYENVIKSFEGKPTIRKKGKPPVTQDQIFAIQAVRELSSRYPGIGTYKQFRAGTSNFQKELLKNPKVIDRLKRDGKDLTKLPFTDERILQYITTLKKKGPVESTYRRIVENIPVSAGMTAGYMSGKRVQSMMPAFPPFKTGYRLFDAPIVAAQSIYNAGKFSLPFVTGLVGSIFTAPVSEEFGEVFLGEKGLATPGTRPLQRFGEAVGDVVSFSPIGFYADKIAGNMTRDYFTNRLGKFLDPQAGGPSTYTFKGGRVSDGKGGFFDVPEKTVSLDKGPMFGRPVDMTGESAKISAYQQMKKAEKTSKEYLYGEGVIRGAGGKPVQGPLTINQLNERGVADVMQGTVPQGTMRKLLAIEDALRAAGKDARNNKSLFAFYESLAALGAGTFAKAAAESKPFTGYEVGAEIAGSIAVPLGVGDILYRAATKGYPVARELYENVNDMGLLRGAGTTFSENMQAGRDAQGFKEIVTRLQEMGTIDSKEQLEEFIAKLEAMPKDPDAKPTAGQLTNDPVIMAMEASLAREFPELKGQQRDARKLEIDALKGVLEQLAFAEGTEYGRAAVRIGAEIRQAIFESSLTSRLDAAENDLLKALNQLKKSKENRNLKNPDGSTMTAKERAELDAMDRIDLSERLMDMLTAQKGFARTEQKRLYGRVGEIDLSQFYDDAGNAVDGPKLLRLLEEQGPFAPGNLLESELKPLFTFARSLKDQLGIQVDLGGETPKLNAYNEARLQAYESGGMDLFDQFVVNELGDLGTDNLPETVTPEMIQAVRQKIGGRGRQGQQSPTGKAYTALLDALLEKGSRLGTISAGPSVRSAQVRTGAEVAFEESKRLFDEATAGAGELVGPRMRNFILDARQQLRAVSDPDQLDATAQQLIQGFETNFDNALVNSGLGQQTINNLVEVLRQPQTAATAALPEGTAASVPASGISFKLLNRVRSDALTLARNGDLSPEARRIAGMYAEAIADDFENVARYGGTDADKTQLRALREANDFSKAFADVYYRSYVGKALKQTRDGEFRLAPETLAMGFNKNQFDPNLLKVRDIQAVGTFAREQGIKGAAGTIDSINGVLDRIIRTARSEAFDPETGTISEKRLKTWLKENRRLGALFPRLFEDLSTFSKAEVMLNKVNINNSAERAEINKQINFTSLLKGPNGEIRTNPTDVVGEVFAAGKDQVENLDRILEVIPKAGQVDKKVVYIVKEPEDLGGLEHTYFNYKDAVAAKDARSGSQLTKRVLEVDREKAMAGLKASVFEYLVQGQPTLKSSPEFNPTKVYKQLFTDKVLRSGKRDAMRSGGTKFTTMAELLKSKGIFNDGDVATAKNALEQMIKVKSADQAGNLVADFESAKPILDFALGISGSAIGTKSQSFLTGGQSGPGSIIAAGKGAEAMRNIFLRMPAASRLLFTSKLLQDPKLLAKMMRTYGNTDASTTGVVNSVKQWLSTNGFVTLPRRAAVADRPEDKPATKPDQFFKEFPVPRADPVQPTVEKKASLQLPSRGVLPAPAPVPSGVQTASVDSAGSGSQRPQSGGISSIDINKARQLFPNDITFAARGGEMRSGIGGLFR